MKLLLVDVNPSMIDAWRASFEENPEVDIVQGSILDQQVSAWVTPTNSKGVMKGGLDVIIKRHLGNPIEAKVQREINRLYLGVMPIGCAVCVVTDAKNPLYLISTPTMGPTSDNVGDTLNVALACAAALQAAHLHNKRTPDSIQSMAMPGLGASAGKVPVEICADLMWTAYTMMKEREFPDFFSLRQGLEERLGDLGSMTSKSKPKKVPPTVSTPNATTPRPAPVVPPAPTPSVKQADVDFDDAE